jgi:hypothetical protein
MAVRGAAERRGRLKSRQPIKDVVMTSLQKQHDAPAAHVFPSGNRTSLTFILVTALAIVLIACALGRATFQSGASGWSPQDAAEAAASLGAP